MINMPMPFVVRRLSNKENLSRLFSTIAQWSAISAVVLALLAYPLSTGRSFELVKQTVSMAFVGLAFLSSVALMFVERKIFWRRSAAGSIVIALLIVIGVSALASSARYVGLLGDGGQEYQSFVTTALFAALFFTVLNISNTRAFISRALMAVAVSGGAVSFIALLKFAGTPLVNPVGGTVMLGLVAAVTVVLCAASFLAMGAGKAAAVRRAVMGVCGIFALAAVIVVDFWPVWSALAAGLLTVIIYAIVNPQNIKRFSWLAVPMATLLVSALILIIGPTLPVHAPVEVFPSFSESWRVAGASLVDHPFFGSGVGTYAQDFSLHRGVELNNNPMWYLRFDRGVSYLLTVSATTGLAGLACWLAIIFVGLWRSALFLVFSRPSGEQDQMTALAVVAAWIASAIGLVAYGASLASLLLFWLLFALTVRVTTAPVQETELQVSPRFARLFVLVLAVVAALYAAGLILTGTRLIADAALSRGLSADSAQRIDEVILDIEKAQKIDPRSATIARNLAQAYLIKIQGLLADPKTDALSARPQVQALSSSAVKMGLLATALVPGDAQNWAGLGAVYESMVAYVDNAADGSLSAYERAAELEPWSPIHLTSMGRIHLAIAAQASSELARAQDNSIKTAAAQKKNEALAAAETDLIRALELKPDYAAAKFQMALVKELQGKISDAISVMQDVARSNPADAGVAYRLAALYYRDGQKAAAVSELERAVALAPSYADAHWLLAAIYEEQGEWDAAIVEVKIVLRDNPDDPTVRAKLQALEAEKIKAKTSSVRSGF